MKLTKFSYGIITTKKSLQLLFYLAATKRSFFKEFTILGTTALYYSDEIALSFILTLSIASMITLIKWSATYTHLSFC